MERERLGGSSIHGNCGAFLFPNSCNAIMDQRSGNRENYGIALDRRPRNGYHDDDDDDYANQLLPVSSSSPPSAASTSSLSGYIEHPVSKFDTLAGVAIRYGVEVADIKRLNGLVTDIQMFALKSLHIPLPGRHPPSTCSSNVLDDAGESSSGRSPPHHAHAELFDSLQSLRLNSSQQKVSPAMSTLQGYYGLESKDQRSKSEARHLGSNPPLSRHRKSKSLVMDFIDIGADQMPINGEESSERWGEKAVRRRQKLGYYDFTAMTPEMVLKGGDTHITGGGGSVGGFSATAGKGLALRSKATAKTTTLAGDVDMPPTTATTTSGLGDLAGTYTGSSVLSSVRKSSSTSSLQDQEAASSLSLIWPTSKWSLKPDLQSLSAAAAITRPIFDGLPKPLTSRRNKAALD